MQPNALDDPRKPGETTESERNEFLENQLRIARIDRIADYANTRNLNERLEKALDELTTARAALADALNENKAQADRIEELTADRDSEARWADMYARQASGADAP